MTNAACVSRTRHTLHVFLATCDWVKARGRLYAIRQSGSSSGSSMKGLFMAAKTVNVGLIGTKFMGKAHSNAYLKVAKFFDVEPQPVMKAICGRHADETAEFAKRFGGESFESDWKKLCEREDIDVVDVA